MQPARLVPIHPAAAQPTSVEIDGEHIRIGQLSIADRGLAAFVAQREAGARAELVERALRIGLLALQDAGISLDVDFVRREFESMIVETQRAQHRAAEALDGVLRANFADGDGRLPRTLEHFLGNRGQLNRFVSELFDESKRDSAIGRMRTLLGSYFEGDGSRLAQLLDPTRLGSPLHQFRCEMNDAFGKLNERLTAIEAAAAARGVERSRSAAKGVDFEDLLEGMLATVVRGSGDVIERTADEAGDVIRSRKGDFLLTIDPRLCRGADLRVVIEAKDRQLSARQMRLELREARQNRGACVALAIFTPAHAPAGAAPFDVRGEDVYCVIDPEAPDLDVLDAGLRLAKLLALASLRDAQSEIDTDALYSALTAIRGELEAVRGLKVQLTSIGNTARDVTTGLDRLREQVLARLATAETELRIGERRPPAA